MPFLSIHRMKFMAITAAILIGLAYTLISVLLGHLGMIESWELKTYDWRMRTSANPPADDIAILYVDEPLLRHMDAMGVGWPWPRELYASALRFLGRAGTRAVFFDILFSEDSIYGVTDDETFAKGIAQGPPAYFALFASGHFACCR